MQKWFDDGYFTADLLMRRTHVDVNWAAVGELAELARRSGSDKLFLSPPAPPAPPGLPRPTDSPGQGFIAPVDQNAYNAPLQPAPVRSLRSSTLDAYAGSSSHSNSPSSSFGAGRFGNGSPDSHGFGGRANNQYSTDPSIGGRFGPSAAPFDSIRPVAVPPTNNGPSPPVQASPWGTAVPAPLPHEPSPWFAASHGVVNEQNWKEERGHSLTFSNLGQHNQQFTSPPEDATKAPVVVNEVVQSVEPEVPVKPVGAPLPTANKTRTKPVAQPAVQPATIPTIPAAESPSSTPSGPPKAAWSKEEEAKRPKASGVTLSLREIQDAEAKKAEARKTAERDRERAVRASSSTVPAPEEAQPFTASWGLPTSQAGVRAAPAKDTAGASPTTAGGAPAVWTNATKPNATKKTMKLDSDLKDSPLQAIIVIVNEHYEPTTSPADFALKAKRFWTWQNLESWVRTRRLDLCHLVWTQSNRSALERLEFIQQGLTSTWLPQSLAIYISGLIPESLKDDVDESNPFGAQIRRNILDYLAYYSSDVEVMFMTLKKLVRVNIHSVFRFLGHH
ncbi:hypothetical protein C8R46DRAFT_43299 [Mycena filopes]|nr:hypothetical protein C8R46DRAFT_43299 [Mycena filopes]